MGRDVGRLGVGRCCRRGHRHRDHQDHQDRRRDLCVAGSRRQDEHHQDHQGHRYVARSHQDERRRDHQGRLGVARSHQDERHQDHQGHRHRRDEARTCCHQRDLQEHRRRDERYLEEVGLDGQTPTSVVRCQEAEELGDPLAMWAVVEALRRGHQERWERRRAHE